MILVAFSRHYAMANHVFTITSRHNKDQNFVSNIYSISMLGTSD